MENENDKSSEQPKTTTDDTSENEYEDDFEPVDEAKPDGVSSVSKVSGKTESKGPVDANGPKVNTWTRGQLKEENEGPDLNTNSLEDPVIEMPATRSTYEQSKDVKNEKSDKIIESFAESDQENDTISNDLINAKMKEERVTVKEGESAKFTVTVHNIYNIDDVRITWYRQSQPKRQLQKGDIYTITTEQTSGKVIGNLEIKMAIQNEEGNIYAKVRLPKTDATPKICSALLTVTEQKSDHWDIYQNETEKWNGVDYKQVEITDKIMKFIRFITHGFLLLAVISSIIISKWSFQILVNQLGLEEKRNSNSANEETVTRTVVFCLLSIIITAPDALSAVMLLLRLGLGKKHRRGESLPTERIFEWKAKTNNNNNKTDMDHESNSGKNDKNDTNDATIISGLYVTREVLHCIGIYAIVFRVLPFLSPIEVYVFPLSLLLLTSLLKFLQNIGTKWLNGIAITILFVLQCGVSVTFLFVMVEKYIRKDIHLDSLIWIIASHFIVPLRWVPTYLHYDKYKGRLKTFIRGISGNMEPTTYSLTRFIAAILRTVVPLVSFLPGYYSEEYQYIGQAFREFLSINTSDISILNETITYTLGCTGGVFEYFVLEHAEDRQWRYLIIGPFVAHIVGAIMTYYFAVLACRLRMRRFGYSIPLSVATPIYVITLLTLSFFDISYFGCYENYLMAWQYGLFGVFIFAWCLQFCLCTNIFQRQKEVMPFKESLFHTPHYCSPIADLSILHSYKNRIRSDEETQPFVKPYPSDSSEKQNGGVKDLERGETRSGDSKLPISNEAIRNSGQKESSTDQNSDIASQRKEKGTDHAMIYVCATMWHEEPNEMKCLILSLLRLDYDRAVHDITCDVEDYNTDPSDKFDFEGHIFFDDAFVNKEKEQSIHEGKKIKNKYVEQLEKSMGEALREFYNSNVQLKPPEEITTLYGKCLTWILPGQNKLVVHLKDKEKFRHMKRWSQVMYFYYLLGYKLLQDKCETKPGSYYNDDQTVQMKHENDKQKIENTFILALDGDVKFYPIALKRLLERMKKNPQVAATSGRIIPCGSGPVVWYQRFEYAVGHWLQKTTEHMFGCVLCSPGCFSLFRATSVLTGNIMRTYASQSTKPRHFIQYDQGEDRWLCTLLLKEGFRVEYCAASEAKTFVPEEFGVLFTQRKRWIPSTLANIFDVIHNSNQIRKKNPSISILYIAYQCLLLVSTVLGPSTILLAMHAAIRVVFDLQVWVVYLLIYGPVAFYILVCLKLSLNVQRQIGLVLSMAYALLMLSVLIGTIVSIIQEGWYTPSAAFLYVLFGTFVLAGLLHIHELFELVFVFLYFILLPLGFLFIMIYAVCNLNDVSWGTRENQDDKNKNPNRDTREKETDESYLKRFQNARHQVSTEFRKEILDRDKTCSSKTQTFLYMFKCSYYILQLKLFEVLCEEKEPERKKGQSENSNMEALSASYLFKNIPNVLDTSKMGSNVKSDEKHENENETLFWRKLKERYLDPIDKNAAAVNELKSYRNKIASMFFFLNGIWIVIVSSMNEVKQDLNITINFSNGNPVVIEPFGFTFLTIFTLLLFVQTIGMLLHRYSTFLHVVAATDMRSHQTHDNLKIKKYVEKLLCPKIQKSEKKPKNDNANDNTIKANDNSMWCCPNRNKIHASSKEQNKANTQNNERKRKYTLADLKSASKKASDINIEHLDLKGLFESRITK